MPTANELLGADEAATLLRILRRESGRQLPALAAAATQEALEPLALSARAAALAAAARQDLPHQARPVQSILRGALDDPAFKGWLIWAAGLVSTGAALEDGGEPAFDDAMDVLAALTHRNTSEFPIRHLLAARPERGLQIMRTWTAHEDTHVRRLASEGSRPLLPWGVRVPALVRTPGLAAPVLEALRTDPEDYVYRSVANHVNDHSRAHPDWVIDTLTRWREEDAGGSDWVIKHALRTLIKRGDARALGLLGFGGADLAVQGPTLAARSVGFGSEVAFTAAVTNRGSEPAKVAVDWALHLMGSRGEGRRKVFKLASPVLAPGETFEIERSFSFRPITTRAYYPGRHGVELLVNGASHGPAPFELLPPVPAPVPAD